MKLIIDNTNISEETVNGWRLSYEFPDQSLTFSRGFALGRLWEKLRRHDKSDHTILTIWAQDAINLAKAQGWIASSEPLEEDAAWSYITFHEFKLHLVDQKKHDAEETSTI